MTPSQIATQTIKDNLYLTLATTDGTKPWVSPVYYAENEQYELIFISDKNSLHARNIN